MKELFLLNPDVIYLNHGSFGACPRPVFDVYQQWQLELEHQPVEFLGRRSTELLAQARSELGTYLGCGADDLVYFPNPTTALNVVARSLDLQPGDEILSSDHEYGAMDRTWRYICARRGAHYRPVPIPLPVSDPEALLSQLWENVGDRTRAIFLSHITSSTAMRMPVEKLCESARQAGIITIIDGAHAPGQIELDLHSLGADFYAGACHKWLCAPKGAAFLYARPEVQALLEPLVISWGWEADAPGPSQFIDHHEFQGTRDLAAFLSVPAAIEFQRTHDWRSVRERCHSMAATLQQQLLEIPGTRALTPATPVWFQQMFAVQLPDLEPEALQTYLLKEHRIEVIAHSWNGSPLLRASLQAYNNADDGDALVGALKAFLNSS